LNLRARAFRPGVRWSDAFIERAFPMRERSQSIDREVGF
jgi:hypothetical protein